jgi:quinol monooxygenase YgiN
MMWPAAQRGGGHDRRTVQGAAPGGQGGVAAFREVIAASRPLDGVISFDIGRDLADPDAFIATEVFEDKAALDRQEALAEVQKTIALLGEVADAEPEATIFHVASTEPWG